MKVSMFQAIVAKKAAILQALGHKFYHEYGDTIAALLCLDHGFRANLKIQAASCTEIASVLQSFVIYSRELARIAHEQDPANDPGLQRLFGFSLIREVENMVRIPQNTFLHKCSLQRNSLNIRQDATEDIHLPSWELKSLIHDAIRDKLLQLVKDENEQCRKAPALSPCSTHAVVRTCTSNTCTAGHFDVQTLDKAWYTARVRIHLQQILIYQTIAPLAPQEHKFTITREQRSALGIRQIESTNSCCCQILALASLSYASPCASSVRVRGTSSAVLFPGGSKGHHSRQRLAERCLLQPHALGRQPLPLSRYRRGTGSVGLSAGQEYGSILHRTGALRGR